MAVSNIINSTNIKQKSYKINVNDEENFINLPLENTHEKIDIYSLTLYQKDLYRLHEAEYGIIVGRVSGQGVGLPNAKISIFIEADENIDLNEFDKQQVNSNYNYKTPLDKDIYNNIYNLLPKFRRNRNFNGYPDNEFGIGATPTTPVGSFPEKEEILTNFSLEYIYDKYYKYTTVTNDSGDYMIILPSNNTYTIHMSCDITDIGRFSTTPALLKLDGYPENYFTNENEINTEIPIEQLPNIDLQNTSIFVKPLWSQDVNNENVGINIVNFNLNKKIKPYITIFGNYFTQNKGSWWGDRIVFRFAMGFRKICIRTRILNWDSAPILPFFKIVVGIKKYCTLNGGKENIEPFSIQFLGGLDECDVNSALSVIQDGINDGLFLNKHEKGNLIVNLFSLKNTIPDEDSNKLNNSIDGNNIIFNNYNINNDIIELQENEYYYYNNNGSFVLLIPCNRNKVISDDLGNLIPTSNDNQNGLFINFRGYLYVRNESEIDNPPTKNRTGKIAMKIPQFFDYGNLRNNSNVNKPWIWKHFNFEYGKIYSVAQRNQVRNDTLKPDEEAVNDSVLFEENKGFASQTNLLLINTFAGQSNQSIVNNIDNNIYEGFYNHVTYLGVDKEENIKFEITSPGQDGGRQLIDNTKFNFTLRKGGSIFSSQQPSANPTVILFDSNGLIFDELILSIFEIDAEFPNQLVGNYSYRIEKGENTGSGLIFSDITTRPEPIPFPELDLIFDTYTLNNFTIPYSILDPNISNVSLCRIYIINNNNENNSKYIQINIDKI